jgi:hypothetical protein
MFLFYCSKRVLLIAILLCLSFANTGCGLLYLPRIETSPGTFNRIEVRDGRTGNLIGNAAVDYYLLKETVERKNNNGLPQSVSAYCGDHQALTLLDTQEKSEKVDFWGYVWWGGTTAPAYVHSEYPARGLCFWDTGRVRTDRTGGGQFTVESTNSLAWDHIWWPIELPLSDSVWPHFHENVVVASAPGYKWENVSFEPGKAEGDGPAYEYPRRFTAVPNSSYKISDHTLVISLLKSGTTHDPVATAPIER